jgi:hypothetical protein
MSLISEGRAENLDVVLDADRLAREHSEEIISEMA